MRIRSIIIFDLSKLWKAKFFIPCDLIYSWWGCRGNLKLITLGMKGFKSPVNKMQSPHFTKASNFCNFITYNQIVFFNPIGSSSSFIFNGCQLYSRHKWMHPKRTRFSPHQLHPQLPRWRQLHQHQRLVLLHVPHGLLRRRGHVCRWVPANSVMDNIQACTLERTVIWTEYAGTIRFIVSSSRSAIKGRCILFMISVGSCTHLTPVSGGSLKEGLPGPRIGADKGPVFVESFARAILGPVG